MDTQTKQKSNQGKLFIVATPIGNLQDITYRAVTTLKSVAYIAAEDTRTSKKLLDYYTISTPLLPCHDHNENKAAQHIMAKLAAGDDVALISDAGTPLINDPGYHVVRLLREHAFEVVTIPGACSPIAALSASGLPTDMFTYLGFLPRKGKSRQHILHNIQQASHTQVFLESPKRILKTLQALQALEDMNQRLCCVGRELTKLHEEFIQGSLHDVVAHFEQHAGRGEMVVMLAGAAPKSIEDADIIRILEQRSSNGLSASALAKEVAEDLSISRSRVYALLHPPLKEAI
ncbi:MAG: 16S rRNA (cytidine(1402)-2'-O)-methyltransferase [Mariprofundaceae bacterium]|nr:16S rRNA (cytidine(1402)-2'-O)-methyltransferase [Mariprofundaceae bacterium]